MLPKYCESVYQTIRRPTRTIHVGLTSTVLLGTCVLQYLPQCHTAMNAASNRQACIRRSGMLRRAASIP